MIEAKSEDFSDWCWTFARSVRFAIHLSMTSRTAGRLSGTSTLVSQPETSDPNQPSSTIQKPLHFTFAHLCSSIVQDLPTIPNPTPRTWWRRSFLLLVIFDLKLRLEASHITQHPWSTTACASCIFLTQPLPPSPLVPLLQNKCPFSPKSATDSESVTQFVAHLPTPRPLCEESVLARGPDVEHYWDMCATFRRGTPTVLRTESSLNHSVINVDVGHIRGMSGLYKAYCFTIGGLLLEHIFIFFCWINKK